MSFGINVGSKKLLSQFTDNRIRGSNDDQLFAMAIAISSLGLKHGLRATASLSAGLSFLQY